MNDTTQDGRHNIDQTLREVDPKSPEPTDEVSELARHGDPSRVKATTPAMSEEEKLRRAVVWMRPTELIPTTTGRVVGRGIDFQAELARRTRALPVQAAASTQHGIRERTRYLAPLSAFGNSGVHHSSLGRDAIGR